MKNVKFLLLLVCALNGCKKAPPPPPPHTVTAAKPVVCNVPVYLDYIGNMVANVSVEVMAQVSGVLVAQYFEQGQFVKQGDLLLVIDPRPYEASLARAKAMLDQSYATYYYDKETTRRYGPLVQQDYISQLNYDQYVTNVLVDDAIIAQNKAQLDTAQIDLGYCYITAPMNCITGKLYVKPGNYVDANSTTQLTLLNQIQPILVDFSIPETDLLMIQEKQMQGHLKLVVYPDSAHKHPFHGELTLINNQVNTGTGAILLEGTLSNEECLLWPGQYADVRLILEEERGALLVPNEAVMVGQKGHYVYIVKSDSTVDVRTVKVGQMYDEKYTSIEGGIGSNDLVVAEGQLNLYPGMKVEVK